MKWILLIVAALLVACETPQLMPPPTSGTSGTAKGGDADTDMPNVDFSVAFAQPGATAVSSPIRNEDRTQSTQAGDSPQLVFGGGGKAALDFLAKSDPVQDLLIEQIGIVIEERGAVGADLAANDARLDALRKELAAHMEKRLKMAGTIAGSFDALASVVFNVLQFKLNGVDPVKLTPDAIKAAAENMKAAMAPAGAALGIKTD